MNNAIARWLCSGLLLAALVGCKLQVSRNGTLEITAGSTAGSDAVYLTDATGTLITLKQPPDRIVCLHLSCLDILAELEKEPIGMSGVLMEFATSSVYFGDRAKTFGQISGRGEPNLEHLLALNPDLIIGHQAQLGSQRETLSSIAPLYLVDVKNYNDAIANLLQVGQLLGIEDKAEAAAAEFRDRLAQYKAKSPNNQSVMVMRGSPGTFFVATQESLVGATLAELTPYPWPLYNFTPTAINWATYAIEDILQVDPDVIFVVTNSLAPDFIEELKQYRIWQELKAVKSGRVYLLDEDKIGGLTTGTRSMRQLVDEVMPKVYPDVFPKPLP